MTKNQFYVWTEFGAEHMISCEKEEGRVKVWRFSFSYPPETSEKERVIHIDFAFPVTDISGWWNPNRGLNRNLLADWTEAKTSMTSASAPILCMFSADSRNRGTLAWSEIRQKVEMHYGVREEDGTMYCRTGIYLPAGAFTEGYQVTFLENFEDIPYWEAIGGCVGWWEKELDLNYLEAPAAAREPLYSFWYSFHQNVDERSVEEECRLAAKMGFASVIVDDGWQTADNNRGYAFCGDWEPEISKFPDMAAHVKRVQDMGLKYMLWFSVPFVGIYTKAWETYKDKMLYMSGKWGVLDIRYPECREYLLKIYEKAVFEWNFDGLKLDFIDSFMMKPESPVWKEGMDCADIQDALNVLLDEVNIRLRAKKPDLLIEFRQSYIGPQVQCYGNMLRVGDCPESGLSNRVGITDLRMMSRSAAVHSDMLMWHSLEKPEVAALQIIDCLFGVLQFSVKLDTLTDEMKKMVGYWMNFMREHETLLQKSMICPLEPENLYPEISACAGDEKVLVHYSAGRVAKLEGDWRKLYYIHGVKEEETVFRSCDGAKFAYKIADCQGEICGGGVLENNLFAQLCVPTAGTVIFERL